MFYCCGNYCSIKFQVFDQKHDFGAIKKGSWRGSSKHEKPSQQPTDLYIWNFKKTWRTKPTFSQQYKQALQFGNLFMDFPWIFTTFPGIFADVLKYCPRCSSKNLSFSWTLIDFPSFHLDLYVFTRVSRFHHPPLVATWLGWVGAATGPRRWARPQYLKVP